MSRLLGFALIFFASTCFAQGILDAPTWNHDEHLTDKQKLEQIEKKAAYEARRKADFAARGIRNYQPATSSVKIALPSTRAKCNERLGQLNRIYKHLSAEGKLWRQYEFDVVYKHFDRLSS